MWQGMKNHPICDRVAIIIMAVVFVASWIWIASRFSDGAMAFAQYMIGVVG